MTVAARGTFVLANDVERYGVAAVMLAQLRWLSVDAKHVTWIERNGERWLAYRDSDWLAVVGLTEQQARRARVKLEEAGEIVTATFKVDGAPTTHFRQLDLSESTDGDVEIDESLDLSESTDAPLPETGETSTRDDALAAAFDLCWQAYPRKVEKVAARKCWMKRVKDGADPADLLRATVNYAGLLNIDKGRPAKHGATFWGPNEPWRDWIDGIPPSELPRQRQTARQRQRDEQMARLHDAIERERQTPDPQELTG